MGGGGGGGWLRVNLVLHFGPNLWVGLWDLALDQAEQFRSCIDSGSHVAWAGGFLQ